MKYNYALIVGLLVSAQVLMGSDKNDPSIFAINTIYENPRYEKCKEIATILTAEMYDRKKWNWTFGKDHQSKEILGYNNGSYFETVLNAKKTGYILGLPSCCETKINELNEIIKPGQQQEPQPKELNILHSFMLTGGTFLLAGTGKIMKIWLSEEKLFSLKSMGLVTAGIITGCLGFISLVHGMHGFYCIIKFNNNYDAELQRYRDTLKTCKEEREKWNDLKSRFESLIKFSRTHSFKD